MTDIVVQTTLGGVAVNGLVDDPEITILRVDTDAVVVNADTMSDQAACGLYKYAFTPIQGIEYSFCIDADPNATGQVDTRTYGGAFNNELNDIWRDRGLDPVNPKTITENTVGEDYDEAVGGAGEVPIAKDTTKIGSVTTIDRT